MTLRPILLAAAALAALTAASAGPAAAQSFEPNYANPQFQGPGRERQRVLSAREIRPRLPAQLGPGEAIEFSDVQGGDRPYYIVLWRRPDGSSRRIRVDAITGRVMG